jgi:hypothetical protein
MEQRLLNKTNKTATCWLWTGYTRKDGYGSITINYIPTFVHRVAFELWKQLIPDGFVVRHTCDIRNCINPNHLEIGTQQDNINDKVERNRQAKGITHGSVKLTEDEVREIKVLLGFGITRRKLASEYNVSKGCIDFISSGKNWKHI